MANSSVSINVPGGGQSGTIPAGAQNISLIIAGASGGSGGFDSGGPGGGAGAGRYGQFSIPSSTSNRSWAGYIGYVGGNGPGGSGAVNGASGGSLPGQTVGLGGRGGDDGASGWSGCGGGGGAASVFYLNNVRVITAGGGGAGGGGSYSCGGSSRPGGDGGTAGAWGAGSTVNLVTGNNGANKGGGDGGGGGGGGGGHSAGGGGGSGQDCQYGGGGGGGGGSRYNSSVVSLTSNATNSGNGYITLSYTLTVAEINFFTIDKTSIINNGETATLSWSVTDSESQSINAGIGAVAAVDDIVVSPTASTTYTLTAVGLAGNDTASVTLTVYQPVVATIRADGQDTTRSITRGQSAELQWVVSGDANQASIDQGIGNVLITSTRDVSPTITTTYTLSASGPGGSDVDDVTVVVNQPPELSFSAPLSINYGDSVSIPVTYRYATSGVSVVAVYTQRNPATGNLITVQEIITLTGTASDESGNSVTNNADLNIPWTLHGTFGISLAITSSGAGGSNTQTANINVIVDETPDSITIPDNVNEIPNDQIAAPDEETVLSDPIVVTDIDVAAEIKSNRPIQVRFDDDDPEIETNWYDVREL